MKLISFLLLFHAASSVKHTLLFMGAASSGLPNLPKFCANLEMDEAQVGYCDSNRRTQNPETFYLYLGWCFKNLPTIFEIKLNYLKKLNHEAVHVLQIITGCEWDEVTDVAGTFLRYAYNGENLFELDAKNLTWIAKSNYADKIKSVWESTEAGSLKVSLHLLMNVCPMWLKKHVVNGDKCQQKGNPPLMSLLQKTPSLPVRCHVTGLCSNRANLFWRKDGEEIHEKVEHSEILPNPDGTFQMSVDLNVSSIPFEDWEMYDCVCQQPGVGRITTRLDKALIRTNREIPFRVVTGVVVVLLLLITLSISGFIFWKKNNGFTPANRSNQIVDPSELQGFKDGSGPVISDQTSNNEQSHGKTNGGDQGLETVQLNDIH